MRVNGQGKVHSYADSYAGLASFITACRACIITACQASIIWPSHPESLPADAVCRPVKQLGLGLRLRGVLRWMLPVVLMLSKLCLVPWLQQDQPGLTSFATCVHCLPGH